MKSITTVSLLLFFSIIAYQTFFKPPVTAKAQTITSKEQIYNLNKQANSLEQKGDHTGAIDAYKQAVELSKQHYGSVSAANMVSSLSNLAGAYSKAGMHTQSFKYYNEALAICLGTLGLNNPITAEVYINISASYQEAGNLKQAILYLKKSIDACNAIGGLELKITKIKRKLDWLRSL